MAGAVATPAIKKDAKSGKQKDEDIEKGLQKILNNSKKEDSELSNKLHASILESLNR